MNASEANSDDARLRRRHPRVQNTLVCACQGHGRVDRCVGLQQPLELRRQHAVRIRLRSMTSARWHRVQAGLVQRGRRLRRRHQSTENVFGRIYARAQGGVGAEPFYSGPGSDPEFGEPYVEAIAGELTPVSAGATVVDLGCGDFRVGRLLLERLPVGVKYVGVDVVGPLVEYHQSRFSNDRVSFTRRDIAADPLPDGDYCLIRQVLQHLSNAQILAVIPKLCKYRRVFVTEHYPSDAREIIPNLDKVHGPDVRSPKSAVYLDQPPFNLQTRELLAVPWGNEVVRTIELTAIYAGPINFAGVVS